MGRAFSRPLSTILEHVGHDLFPDLFLQLELHGMDI
jgi:hypothetical protein